SLRLLLAHAWQRIYGRRCAHLKPRLACPEPQGLLLSSASGASGGANFGSTSKVSYSLNKDSAIIGWSGSLSDNAYHCFLATTLGPSARTINCPISWTSIGTTWPSSSCLYN